MGLILTPKSKGDRGGNVLLMKAALCEYSSRGTFPPPAAFPPGCCLAPRLAHYLLSCHSPADRFHQEMSPYVCALDLGEWDERRRKRRDWSLAVLERGVCHGQAELGLSQVARQFIGCCNGAARVTSSWYQGVRENAFCRGQGEIQVKSGCLGGLGMKGPAGAWVGKAGSALPATKPLSHPTTLLPAE